MKEFKDIKIAVAGTGYVGLSIATLLAQHHHVTAVDVVPEKVEKLNKRISPIQDEYIEKYLAEKPLDLVATLDGKAAYKDADFVVIAAPTNYDPVKNYFDTTHVEEVIDLVLEVNPDAVMVIKSTIPVGYTRNLYLKYAAKGVKQFNLLFSPEFLRESKALLKKRSCANGAIIQLLSLKTITDIVSQKTFQPFLKICLRKGWNAPNNYSNGLRQGIFNKSYDFLITLTNIIVNLFKTILFVT